MLLFLDKIKAETGGEGGGKKFSGGPIDTFITFPELNLRASVPFFKRSSYARFASLPLHLSSLANSCFCLGGRCRCASSPDWCGALLSHLTT